MKTGQWLVNSMDEALRERVRQDLEEFIDSFADEPNGVPGQFEAARWLADQFPGQLASFAGFLLVGIDAQFDLVNMALDFAECGGLDLSKLKVPADPAYKRVVEAALKLLEALEISGVDLSAPHAGRVERTGNALAEALGYQSVLSGMNKSDFTIDSALNAIASELGSARSAPNDAAREAHLSEAWNLLQESIDKFGGNS